MNGSTKGEAKGRAQESGSKSALCSLRWSVCHNQPTILSN